MWTNSKPAGDPPSLGLILMSRLLLLCLFLPRQLQPTLTLCVLHQHFITMRPNNISHNEERAAQQK